MDVAVQFMPGSDVLVVVPSTWNSYNVESRKYDAPVDKLDKDAVAENLSGMLTLSAGVPGGGGGACSSRPAEAPRGDALSFSILTFRPNSKKQNNDGDFCETTIPTKYLFECIMFQF